MNGRALAVRAKGGRRAAAPFRRLGFNGGGGRSQSRLLPDRNFDPKSRPVLDGLD